MMDMETDDRHEYGYGFQDMKWTWKMTWIRLWTMDMDTEERHGTDDRHGYKFRNEFQDMKWSWKMTWIQLTDMDTDDRHGQG